MIRLMIVDDHPMVREGFKLLLEQDSNIIEWILTFRKAPGIILLDHLMNHREKLLKICGFFPFGPGGLRAKSARVQKQRRPFQGREL